MGLTARLRGAIYDAAIVEMTAGWYRAVLEGLFAGGGRRELLRRRPGVVDARLHEPRRVALRRGD